MADLKISELSNAGALDGSESVEIVQSGSNVKTTTQDIADLGGGGPGTVDWGDVGGTLSDQTDLQTALNAKEDESNKATDFSTINDTLYPSVQAVENRIITAVAGLKWKESVRVATTVAGTLASSFENGDTVDGVVLATGNRILIKNQADQTTNGIYTVNASGAPTRSTDANIADELEGASVTVEEGTSNANTTWLQTTDSITLGVSNIVWSAFGSSVPDADATTKGIARLYPSTSLGSNTDGAPDQNAVKVYTDAALALKGDLANTATALTDGSSIAITGTKHTLTTDEATITFSQSYTGDFSNIDVTFNTTAATWTFPAGSLCVVEGSASGNNTATISAVSGDKIVISIWFVAASTYRIAIKNFGQ